MHTSLARRLAIAATTLAMVAIGTGTAGAEPPPHSAASSDGPGGGSGNAAGKAASGPADRFWVDTTVDTVDADIGDGQCEDADGDCSLRAAVQEANAAGERVRIRLDKAATYVLDRPGAGEDFAATGDLDVTGNVAVKGDATIDATGLGDRLFDVAGDAALALDGPDLVGGTPPSGESGGAIRSAGTTDLKKVDVSDSVAEGPGASGGAVFNAGGHLAIKNSTLSANHASRAGGAIEANAGTTELKNVELVDNSTGAMPGNGGGLHLTGAGIVDVRDAVVSGNTAAAEGGGLWNSAVGTMTVSGTRLVGNIAEGDLADNGGGALFNDGGSLTVKDSTIEGNAANGSAGSGGGILNDQGSLVVTRSSITDNTSNRAGGGIEANVGTTELDRVNLSRNETGASPGNGGGLHLTGAGTVDVTRSRVKANTASAEGGGLWNSGVGTMSVSRSWITDNVASGAGADQGGGGLFNDGGALTVDATIINGNVADGTSGSGGGILNDQGSLVVTRSSVSNNTSKRAGGGIEANVGTTELDRVNLSRNETGASPGNGGGLHLTGAGTVEITRSRVVRNTAAAEGGGLWNSATGTMTVNNSWIRRNQAPLGPDVFNDGGTFTLDGELVTVGG